MVLKSGRYRRVASGTNYQQTRDQPSVIGYYSMNHVKRSYAYWSARAYSSDLPVERVNALDADSLQGAAAWVSQGSTVALVGSSGVGKSTLVNSLSGKELTKTAAIREQDGKGRHTTSYRSLHRLANGGLLLDVPGMSMSADSVTIKNWFVRKPETRHHSPTNVTRTSSLARPLSSI